MSDIWHARPTPELLNDMHANTACAALGIRISEVGDDFIRGVMPVDARTIQPYGLLHGGASVVLAETLGSCAAIAVVDARHFTSVGSHISANHVRSARSGLVTGTARPLHIGRTSQLWQIDIVDDAAKPVCMARLTATVVPVKRDTT